MGPWEIDQVCEASGMAVISNRHKSDLGGG